ncbi:unnamed protein product [Candidula unifasciata]|uniref:H-type lectin domain-containing protein n=1 Tax=Candidula unifasciata TaxID=100452 RepID=A0A8S3ZQ16_9EUPU|nr:unnamed protein product [Candidula unifasciata]
MKANFCNNSLTHSEQGTVVCRQSNGWGDKCQLREETKHVRFSVPYAKTPVVSLAAVSVDVDDISKYSLKVRDLTTAGFTVVCATWWDTNINSLEVQWTSVAA